MYNHKNWGTTFLFCKITAKYITIHKKHFSWENSELEFSTPLSSFQFHAHLLAQSIQTYDLVLKDVQMRVGFLTVNKIHFKYFVLLLLCVCVHNWSVSQRKQYELQIWSNWRNIYINYYFLKVKSATKFDPCKRTRSRWVLLMLSFMYMTNLHRGDIALHTTQCI